MNLFFIIKCIILGFLEIISKKEYYFIKNKSETLAFRICVKAHSIQKRIEVSK